MYKTVKLYFVLSDTSIFNNVVLLKTIIHDVLITIVNGAVKLCNHLYQPVSNYMHSINLWSLYIQHLICNLINRSCIKRKSILISPSSIQ